MAVQTISADVLVVGGGLAALRAAYDARRAGADVLVVVKGRSARSGSSAMTSAGYSSVVSADDSPAQHFADTIAGGYGLSDRRLVEIMTAEAPARLDELVRLGGALATQDGAPVVHPSGDHRWPRTVVSANFNGRDFTLPLGQAITELGVRVLEHSAVVDLAVVDGQMAGAIVLSYRDDPALIAVRAGAVILGTGGAGHLFAITSNPADSTGDGYALGLRAGVPLRDMEFIQFYPWRCIVPFDGARMPIQPSTFVHGAQLHNSAGERFMLRYYPRRGEATTRDIAARGIYDQIRAGLDIDGGVLLDVSALDEETWRRSNPKPAAAFDRDGRDYRTTRMILSPEAHFNMGGLVIDEQAETEVRGLFGVGEVAGGVHGANRLDSNALPETQVFGARAGLTAAARRGEAIPELADDLVAAWQRRWNLAAAGSRGLDELQELRRLLQETMWNDLGIVRTRERLEHGLGALAEIGHQLGTVAASSPPALKLHVELEHSVLVGTASMRAALTRTESRGAHYRTDYPEADPHWERVVVVEMAGVDLQLRTEPVPGVTRV